MMSNETRSTTTLPYLGFGLRLRKEYLQPILSSRPAVDWFEIISESYLDDGEEILQQLEELGEDYPLVMHGISLAIGSPWPLDRPYLNRLKRLIDRLQPAWVSDHLCWSGADDLLQGKLLPLPYTRDTLEHLVPRIQEVQEILQRPILLENVPMEQDDEPAEIDEADFLAEVAERSDSLILLDIANLHTSSVNQGFDCDRYLSRLPAARIQQIHLAGAVALCKSEIDDSEQRIDPVWQLYTRALDRFGPISTMIERVDTIPPLAEMVHELKKARRAARCHLTSD